MAQNSGVYEVKPGDTLFSIARAHDLTVQELQQLNNLTDGRIRSGMMLRIRPENSTRESEAGVESSSEGQSESERLNPTEIQAGLMSQLNLPSESDYTVATLSQELGILEEDLWHLNPDIEQVVEALNNLADDSVAIPTAYTVKRGDTLYGIARQTGLSVSALTEMNNLTGSGIQPGQSLQIGSELPEGTSRWEYSGSVEIAVYPEAFNDRMLQSGMTYHPSGSFVSHPTLESGTVLLLRGEGIESEVLCIVADESLSLKSTVMDASASIVDAIGNVRNVEVFTLK